jgi:hypothetical protein
VEDAVNFDIGEVLTRAWQIAWKNKALWWFGGAFGLFFSLILLISMAPVFLLPQLSEKSTSYFTPVLMVAFIVFFFLLMLAMYPISAIAQTSLTVGVLDAVQVGDLAPIRDLIKKAFPFFWRVLGLMFLYAFAVTVIVGMIQVIVLLLTVVTFGIGMICAMPLFVLMYPAMYLAIVWMEQAMNGIILDNMSVMEAIKQGWQLVRNNLLPVGLLTLVLYFGAGMIMGIVMMPMMFPIFMVPFSLMEHQTSWVIVSLSVLIMVAFIPLLSAFFGWWFVFLKAAWILTYLRLKSSPDKLQPVLQGATA